MKNTSHVSLLITSTFGFVVYHHIHRLHVENLKNSSQFSPYLMMMDSITSVPNRPANWKCLIGKIIVTRFKTQSLRSLPITMICNASDWNRNGNSFCQLLFNRRPHLYFQEKDVLSVGGIHFNSHSLANFAQPSKQNYKYVSKKNMIISIEKFRFLNPHLLLIWLCAFSLENVRNTIILPGNREKRLSWYP